MQRQQNLLAAEFHGTQTLFRFAQLLPDEYSTLNKSVFVIQIKVHCSLTKQWAFSLCFSSTSSSFSISFLSTPSMLHSTLDFFYSTD
jgi:hypothetical protein